MIAAGVTRPWRHLLAVFGAYARVRRRSVEGPDGTLGDDEALLQQARALMPRGYDVDAIYEYPRVDVRAAWTWMEAQSARRGLYRYLPLLGRDCFTFAKDALQRAGAPVLLWQLYLQRGDGAIRRSSNAERRNR